MHLVHAQSDFPTTVTSSLFLAGPTPRASLDPTCGWRDEALDILSDMGYKGTVYLPETKGQVYDSYTNQLDWEVQARQRADALVFWVPRTLDTMPGFTTNIEFGEDMHSGRLFYGRPDGAPKTKYLDLRYEAITGTPPFTDLRTLLDHTLHWLGQGALRTGPEVLVPLHAWQHPGFQSWYARVRGAGHHLDGLTLTGTIGAVHASQTPPFGLLLHPHLRIQGEHRLKTNEVVVIRPDISSVVVLLPTDQDPDVLLVREFRSPAGHLLELPGGSDAHDTTPTDLAAIELLEETGLALSPDRLFALGAQQSTPTLCSHQTHAYLVVATPEEAERLRMRAASGLVMGADGNERITLEIRNTAHETGDLDWATQGILARALMMARHHALL